MLVEKRPIVIALQYPVEANLTDIARQMEALQAGYGQHKPDVVIQDGTRLPATDIDDLQGLLHQLGVEKLVTPHFPIVDDLHNTSVDIPVTDANQAYAYASLYLNEDGTYELTDESNEVIVLKSGRWIEGADPRLYKANFDVTPLTVDPSLTVGAYLPDVPTGATESEDVILGDPGKQADVEIEGSTAYVGDANVQLTVTIKPIGPPTLGEMISLRLVFKVNISGA